MAMSLGGRAAELIFYGDFSTGAQNDLEQVTESAYKQVLLYGMSESVGHVSFPQTSPHGQRLYGEQTASLVDTEVRNAIQVTMDRVLELLKEKKHFSLVVEYCKKNLPNHHPLAEKGWKRLPFGEDMLPDHVAVPVGLDSSDEENA